MRGTEATYDWSVLELPEVQQIADQAARKMSKRYADYAELDDLTQDAAVILAREADKVREYVEEDNLGGLQHRLEQRLYNTIETDMKRRQKQIPYSRIEQSGAEEGDFFIRPYVAVATASAQYTRESVETLMPAVWDDSYAYGLPQKETAPDPDMPRGSGGNKAHGNNLAAYIADVKVGYEKANLTLKERRALLMAYGLGWTPKQMAEHEDVTRQTIEERVINGVGKVMDRMNGGYWSELLGVEA